MAGKYQLFALVNIMPQHGVDDRSMMNLQHGRKCLIALHTNPRSQQVRVGNNFKVMRNSVLRYIVNFVILIQSYGMFSVPHRTQIHGERIDT